MEVDNNDKDYLELVNHILDNDKFNGISNFSHHGTNRLNHSKRVSYYSYLVSKKLNLDYKTAAIAGLLHDFYYNEEEGTILELLKIQVNHPKVAAINAKEHFDVSDKEKNIIETHMFPLNKPSRHLEGWVVSMVDKTVGTYEYSVKFRYQFTLWIIFILNIMRISGK